MDHAEEVTAEDENDSEAVQLPVHPHARRVRREEE
jgi:hypothetical protein